MIRDIRNEDIGRCLDIYNHYILHSDATFETEVLSPDEFAKRVSGTCAEYPWLVYEEGGSVLGYAYLSAFNPRQAYCRTADLAVYVDCRETGRGIGRQLMQAVLSLAEKDGYRYIVSIITEGNTASIRLHESAGFEHKVFFEGLGFKNGKVLGVHYYVFKTGYSGPLHEPVNLPYE